MRSASSENTGDAGLEAFDKIAFADPEETDLEAPEEEFMEDPFPDPFGTEGFEQLDDFSEFAMEGEEGSRPKTARPPLADSCNLKDRRHEDGAMRPLASCTGDSARKSDGKSDTARRPSSDKFPGQSGPPEGVRLAGEGQTLSGDAERPVDENEALSNREDRNADGRSDESSAETGRDGRGTASRLPKDESAFGDVSGRARTAASGEKALPDLSGGKLGDGFDGLLSGNLEGKEIDWSDAAQSDDLGFSERDFLAIDAEDEEGRAESSDRFADVSRPDVTGVTGSRFPLAPKPDGTAPETDFSTVGHSAEPGAEKAGDSAGTSSSGGASCSARPESKVGGRLAFRVPTLILAVGVVASAGILAAVDPRQVADPLTLASPASVLSLSGPASPSDTEQPLDEVLDEPSWKAEQAAAGAGLLPDADSGTNFAIEAETILPVGGADEAGDLNQGKGDAGNGMPLAARKEGDFLRGDLVDLAGSLNNSVGRRDVEEFGNLPGGLESGDAPASEPVASIEAGAAYNELGQSFPELAPKAADAGLRELNARIDLLAGMVASQSDEIRRLGDMAGEIRNALAGKEAQEKAVLALGFRGERHLQSVSGRETAEDGLPANLAPTEPASQSKHPVRATETESSTQFKAAETRTHSAVESALGNGSSVYDRISSGGGTGAAPAEQGYRVAAMANPGQAGGYHIGTLPRTASESRSIAQVRVGDRVGGYGRVLDIVPDDIGGHLVVMERGTVYVRR